MPKRCQLTARAQINGEVREPGYIFVLADGEIGPHRPVVAHAPHQQITDQIGPGQRLQDEPLYVVLGDVDAADQAPAEASGGEKPERDDGSSGEDGARYASETADTRPSELS